MMPFNYNDGGRADAGYKGKTGDCVTRAITIATGKPYTEVYSTLFNLGKEFENTHRCRTAKKMKTAKSGSLYDASPRYGVSKKVYHPYLLALGWIWVPTMLIGQGCKVHLHTGELQMGVLIVQLSRHITTVIDGVINDTYNPCRADENGCAGSWIKVENGVETRGTIGERCVYGYYYKP